MLRVKEVTIIFGERAGERILFNVDRLKREADTAEYKPNTAHGEDNDGFLEARDLARNGNVPPAINADDLPLTPNQRVFFDALGWVILGRAGDVLDDNRLSANREQRRFIRDLVTIGFAHCGRDIALIDAMAKQAKSRIIDVWVGWFLYREGARHYGRGLAGDRLEELGGSLKDVHLTAVIVPAVKELRALYA